MKILSFSFGMKKVLKGVNIMSEIYYKCSFCDRIISDQEYFNTPTGRTCMCSRRSVLTWYKRFNIDVDDHIPTLKQSIENSHKEFKDGYMYGHLSGWKDGWDAAEKKYRK